MIGPVELGGKYWAHNGECSTVRIGPHIHYGQNVILGLDPKSVPVDILEVYYVLFGNPDVLPPQGVLNPYEDICMETTDAPPYETTALIPKPRKRKPKKRPKPAAKLPTAKT